MQKILRSTNHKELPDGEIQFTLHVNGKEEWSWADIKNNGAVKDIPMTFATVFNEMQDDGRPLSVDEKGSE